MSIHIRNPHSALAALETRPEDVTQIIAPSASMSDGWEKVVALARRHRIPVTTSGPKSALKPQGRGAPDLDRTERHDRSDGRTSGAEAIVKDRDGISIEELFEGARDRANGKGLWIALDCLQDPHNVGAIFRAASFFGVQGIVLTQERSAPLTGTVYDVASGGLEHVPFTLQTNLQRAFEAAKDAGLWILGTSEHAQDDLSKIEVDRPWLLVLGNEEKGMRRLTEETCDVLCRITPKGGVTSLNVAVAAGVFISALTRNL